MPELDHHNENESRYSCDHCQETGIDIESREYCTACELGKRRMNLDRLADPLRHHPFTNAMWVAHHSAMKTERAIAAAELALLKSKLIQAERRAAQPVVLSEDLRDKLRDAIAAALGEAMDCTRVWSAWSRGTMWQDDFSLVAEDDDRLEEIVDAALGAILNVANGEQHG